MNQLPVPASSAAGEYRALEVMAHVPAGCRGVLVMDDRFAPHLRCGEFAVVDTADPDDPVSMMNANFPVDENWIGTRAST